LLQRPKGHFVVATFQGTVVEGERRPLAVARETRAVTLGEKPLKSS
jgi:hypothetical protein